MHLSLLFVNLQLEEPLPDLPVVAACRMCFDACQIALLVRLCSLMKVYQSCWTPARPPSPDRLPDVFRHLSALPEAIKLVESLLELLDTSQVFLTIDPTSSRTRLALPLRVILDTFAFPSCIKATRPLPIQCCLICASPTPSHFCLADAYSINPLQPRRPVFNSNHIS